MEHSWDYSFSGLNEEENPRKTCYLLFFANASRTFFVISLGLRWNFWDMYPVVSIKSGSTRRNIQQVSWKVQTKENSKLKEGTRKGTGRWVSVRVQVFFSLQQLWLIFLSQQQHSNFTFSSFTDTARHLMNPMGALTRTRPLWTTTISGTH